MRGKGKKTDTPPFEQSLVRLEEIVRELEDGELNLEDALSRFAEGVSLSQQCLKQLNAADQQMDLILKECKGNLEEMPLQIEGEEKC